MTREQLNYIEFASLTQLGLLTKIKKQYHKNQWTEKFEDDFQETRSKIIWDIENLFLLPVYSFIPTKRDFKEEDEPLRNEISQLVINYFREYKQNNTDE